MKEIKRTLKIFEPSDYSDELLQKAYGLVLDNEDITYEEFVNEARKEKLRFLSDGRIYTDDMSLSVEDFEDDGGYQGWSGGYPNDEFDNDGKLLIEIASDKIVRNVKDLKRNIFLRLYGAYITEIDGYADEDEFVAYTLEKDLLFTESGAIIYPNGRTVYP